MEHDKEMIASKIQELVDQNRKIEAIKVYKELTGCDLKEAKRYVEYNHPYSGAGSEKKSFEEPEHTANGSRKWVLIIGLVVFAAAIYLLLPYMGMG